MLYPLHNPGAPLDLDLDGLKLTAFSISAVATYVLVPDFDACFDLGFCPLEAVKLRHVFLSHCHLDHCAGVPLHMSLRKMYGSRPSRVFAPARSAPRLRAVLTAFDHMEEDEAISYDETVVGLAPGDTVRISGRYSVNAFEARHRIDSLGYTVTESRRKLRPEFAELPGPEIARAKQRGEIIHDVQTINAFTYIGDSTLETLLQHPEVGQSQVLFLEATHLPGTGREVSATWGHTHLEELIDLAHDRPEIFASRRIVLKHFSTRYAHHEVEAARKLLPAWLRPKVTLLAPSPRHP